MIAGSIPTKIRRFFPIERLISSKAIYSSQPRKDVDEAPFPSHQKLPAYFRIELPFKRLQENISRERKTLPKY